MRPALAVAIVIACSGNRVAAPPPPPTSRDAAIADAAAPDAVVDPRARLIERGFSSAVAVIDRRVGQRDAKMRLTAGEAEAALRALVMAADREPMRALVAVMPRSTVELARAAAERGVPVDEVDRIATHLAAVVAAMRFERLTTFDENHSHVTGRDWSEIDYSGEGMTWQSQQAYWSPRGVTSFKRAAFIHAYFVGAETLPHWKRVYRPHGRMQSIAAP